LVDGVLLAPLSLLGVVSLQGVGALKLRVMPMEFDLLHQKRAHQLHQLRLFLHPVL
jgi:hypothetical protein